ncbi:hypothetical protein V8E51_000077 [Hyaloscypha variabilis]
MSAISERPACSDSTRHREIDGFNQAVSETHANAAENQQHATPPKATSSTSKRSTKTPKEQALPIIRFPPVHVKLRDGPGTGLHHGHILGRVIHRDRAAGSYNKAQKSLRKVEDAAFKLDPDTEAVGMTRNLELINEENEKEMASRYGLYDGFAPANARQRPVDPDGFSEDSSIDEQRRPKKSARKTSSKKTISSQTGSNDKDHSQSHGDNDELLTTKKSARRTARKKAVSSRMELNEDVYSQAHGGNDEQAIMKKSARKTSSKKTIISQADSNDKDHSQVHGSNDKQPEPKKTARKTGSKKTISSQTELNDEDHSQSHDQNGQSRDGCGLCTVADDDRTSNNATIPHISSENETASVGLQGDRRIYITGLSDAFASYLGNEIAKYDGPARIQKERSWGESYEVKLKGDPWGSYKNHGMALAASLVAGDARTGQIAGDSGASREETFLRHMFRVMYTNGYSVSHMMQGIRSPGIFYFKKSATPPRGAIEVMTIAFHNPDRVRLTCAPQDFIDAVKSLLEKKYKFKGERKKTQKSREKLEQKQLSGEAKELKRHKVEASTAVEYVVGGGSWQFYHPYFTYAREKRSKVSNGVKFQIDLIDLTSEYGWKRVIEVYRGFRTADDGKTHVGNAWYFYREQDASKGKQVGFTEGILQRVVGGSSKAVSTE